VIPTLGKRKGRSRVYLPIFSGGGKDVKMDEGKNQIDGRTRLGRCLRDVKKSVKSDLDAGAVEILQEDLANLQVLQKLIVQSLLNNPDNILDKKGNCSPALNAYLKFHTASKGVIIALKRISDGKPPPRGLADLFEDE
jgi:hypothetical protein